MRMKEVFALHLSIIYILGSQTKMKEKQYISLYYHPWMKNQSCDHSQYPEISNDEWIWAIQTLGSDITERTPGIAWCHRERTWMWGIETAMDRETIKILWHPGRGELYREHVPNGKEEGTFRWRLRIQTQKFFHKIVEVNMLDSTVVTKHKQFNNKHKEVVIMEARTTGGYPLGQS